VLNKQRGWLLHERKKIEIWNAFFSFLSLVEQQAGQVADAPITNHKAPDKKSSATERYTPERTQPPKNSTKFPREVNMMMTMTRVIGALWLLLLLVVVDQTGSVVAERDGLSPHMSSLRGGTVTSTIANINEDQQDLRRLSLARSSGATDDDGVSKSSSSSSGGGAKRDATDDNTSSTSSTSTIADSKPTGSIASRTSTMSSSKSSSTSTANTGSSGMSSSSLVAATKTSSTSSSTSKSSTPSTNSTDTSGGNSTSSVPSEQADSGEPSYERPLPTTFQYEDDDSFNSHGYKITRPLNPVVDDILQFLDDDSYGNTTRLFPKEKDEPIMWPFICIGLFVAAAAVLFGSVAFKNYWHRKQYDQIPTHLTV
jgi:cobalamin biosynthesis Mg chelatase CobN